MKNTSNPDPREIVATHVSLLRLIVEALQSGTRHAQEYADWKDEGIDRYLAPALVRKGAKRFLAEKGQRAEEEREEGEWDAEHLPNLGLALSADGVKIRILKSDNGNLPVPGPSKIRQKFYSQQGTLFDLGKEKDDPSAESVINLVLHWSTDVEYSLDKVFLAAPRSGDLTRSSVKAFFDEPIWRRRRHDILGTQVEAEISDLDIHLDAEEDTGKE